MRRCRQHPREAGKPHNRPRSPRSRTCYPGTIRRRSASGVSVLVSIWWVTRARVARRWREQYDAESGASRQTTSDHPVGADRHVERDAGGHSSAGASGRKGLGSREMPGPGLLRTVGTPVAEHRLAVPVARRRPVRGRPAGGVKRRRLHAVAPMTRTGSPRKTVRRQAATRGHRSLRRRRLRCVPRSLPPC